VTDDAVTDVSSTTQMAPAPSSELQTLNI
jgi:hypothetical protein